MKRTSILSIALCALFAALSAALAQVGLPIGQVPVVLTQVSIFLAAGLLGAKLGTLSQMVYVAMGALGLPVFAGFKGGPSALVGPTGGFLLGYLLSALTVGLLLDKFGRKPWVVFPSLALGALVIYLPGVPWLMHVAHLSLNAGLAAGMLPYLPGDALKVILAGLLILPLHKVLQKRGVRS
jgi:biotin transport system substrate-specific component